MNQYLENRKGERGQMAVTAFVASVVLVLAVGTAIYFASKEQKKVEQSGKSVTAMKMAEQALSRAVWKMEERVGNWDTLMTGGTLPGYNFDQIYTEGDGEYTIQIASAIPANYSGTDRTSKVVVTVVGRDKDHTDSKALKVVYSNESEKPDFAVYILNEKKHKRQKRDKHEEYKQEGKQSSFLTPLLYDTYAALKSIPDKFVQEVWADDDKDGDDFDEDQMKGVHWGPIVALGDMNLGKKGSKSWNSYPRKLATGNIKGRDTNKEAPPNTDGKEWWSYDDSVPTPPTIDFDYYRGVAKGTAPDLTNFPAGGIYHTKGNGSDCVPSHGKRGGKNEDKKEDDDEDNHWLVDQVDTYGSPRCYFFDNVNCKISGDTYIEGTIIVVNKKLMVKEGKRSHSQGQYTCAVLPNAWGEYLKLPDPSASGEYPADTGYHSVAATYTFDASNPVTVKGLLYATKEVQLKGNATVHGVVIVGKKFKFDGSGNAQVFYDHTLKVKSTEVSLVRDSYNEIKRDWPSGL